MAGEENGRAARRLAAEDIGEHLDCDRVETGERFVEYEQLRLVQQRCRELGALLVAVGELFDRRVGALGEPEPLEPPRCRDARRGVAQPVQRPEVRELLRDRHPRVEAALLRHVPETQSLFQPDRPPVPEHLATVGLDDAEDGTHHGRLPGPVRAEKAEHPAARHRERAAVERLHLAEPLTYIDDAEHGRQVTSRRATSSEPARTKTAT